MHIFYFVFCLFVCTFVYELITEINKTNACILHSGKKIHITSMFYITYTVYVKSSNFGNR